MKINPLLVVLFSILWMCAAFVLPAHAEEPVPAPEPASVQVNDPAVSAKLDNLQQTLDQIAAALAPEEEEDPTATPTPEPTPMPDYTAQLEVIADGVQQIKENTTPATPEPFVSAFEKPFEEYSTTEVLLLCLGVVIVFAFVGLVFLRR